MHFCLQCGASVAPIPPSAAPPVAADPLMSAPPAPMSAPGHPPRKGSPTVPLKIAPTPVISPRAEAAEEPAPSSPDDQTVEDDESLKKSFLRPVTQVGAVICRFCKGPLDLDGDFCEQCGAPVSEAAPPGMIKPKPHHPTPAPAAPLPPPSKPAQAAPPPRTPVGSAPARQPGVPPPPPAKPAIRTEPPRPTPTRTPVPAPPTSPPTPPAEDQPSGLMGRLKGLFKKG